MKKRLVTPVTNVGVRAIVHKLRTIALGLFILLNLSEAPELYGQTTAVFSSFQYRGLDAVGKSSSLKRGQFLNPILPGMYPDPSIVRVGEDYYLVTSTFSWYPGVPIFHSKDLVHWRQIGFVLNRPSQLDLGKLQMSQGIFAPTLRYHNGVFYLITTLVGGTGTFYVAARVPSGPWSDPVRIPELDGIDPSFFFDDDGTTYIVHNARPAGKPLYDEQRVIWLVPFDLDSGTISGEPILLMNGGPDIGDKPRWIEGPHIYKRNGYYYLFTALGGTSLDHSEIVFRSRSVKGPFLPDPDNPVLSQWNLRNDRPDPVGATGHVDMVETQNGTWWAVFLGVRPYAPGLYNTGRETFLMPVSWKADWPVILGPGEAVKRIVEQPNLASGQEALGRIDNSSFWEDNFDEESLKFDWQTIRTPELPCWVIATQQHELLLHPTQDDLTSKGHPCLLARRQKDNDFTASINLHVDFAGSPVDAGLVIIQNEHSYYFIGIAMQQKKKCVVFVERGAGSIEAPNHSRIVDQPLKHCGDKVRLRITENGADLSFSFRQTLHNWNELLLHADGTVLSTAKAGGFVGTFIGPFARLSYQ